MEVCVAADHRLAEKHEAVAAAQAQKPDTQLQRDLTKRLESQNTLLSVVYGQPHSRQRIDVPSEITNGIVLELLALLGPDVGDDGETILRRVARDAPWQLGPAVDKLLTGVALSNSTPGLLVDLTEAYYLDDDEGVESVSRSMEYAITIGAGLDSASRSGPAARSWRSFRRTSELVWRCSTACLTMPRALDHASSVVWNGEANLGRRCRTLQERARYFG